MFLVGLVQGAQILSHALLPSHRRGGSRVYRRRICNVRANASYLADMVMHIDNNVVCWQGAMGLMIILVSDSDPCPRGPFGGVHGFPGYASRQTAIDGAA